MLIISLQNYHYYEVAKHTPVIIAESGDCGTTHVRFLAGDAVENHESRQLNNACPVWVMDVVCQVSVLCVVGVVCGECSVSLNLPYVY